MLESRCQHDCNWSGTRREMAYIYESWLQASEVWTRSTVYLNVTCSQGTRRRGVKRWMTRCEIEKQYGESVAMCIIEHKLNNPELCEQEVRWHPDCPGVEATIGVARCVPFRVLEYHTYSLQEARQYWVLDSESTEEVKEDWISRLFKAAEQEDSEPSSSPRSAEKKKKKEAAARQKENQRRKPRARQYMSLCLM